MHPAKFPASLELYLAPRFPPKKSIYPYLTVGLDKLTGTCAGVFVLTRQEPAGKWVHLLAGPRASEACNHRERARTRMVLWIALMPDLSPWR
jgi:hypothetical protein